MNWLGSVLLGALVPMSAALVNPPSADAQDSDRRFAGRWEGAARTPGGLLSIALELEAEDASWTGMFVIPAEGVTVPLSRVRTAADSIVLPLAPERELRGLLAGDSITGALEIQGRVFPVTLGRSGSRTAERLMAETRNAAEAARPDALVLTEGGGSHPLVDQRALDRLIAAADRANSHSMVVLVEDNLVGAWHAGGERRRVETMSVTKSVLNLAVGRLVTLGVIPSIDEPVHVYYPEWRDGSKSGITIWHLLNHTSGIHSPQPTAAIYESDDFVRFALDAELVAPPGSKLVYNNNATNLLAGLAGRAAGERLDRFLAEDLFAELGMDDFRWSLDQAGNPHGMAGLQMYAEDLAKLGHLVLNSGRWQGEQLIEAGWFDKSLNPGSDLDEDVGLLWWLIREDDEIVGYRADGYLGQYLVIYPEHGLVAVRLVAQTPAYNPETDGFRDFQNLVRSLVSPEGH